jgi:hypothetical protein
MDDHWWTAWHQRAGHDHDFVRDKQGRIMVWHQLPALESQLHHTLEGGFVEESRGFLTQESYQAQVLQDYRQDVYATQPPHLAPQDALHYARVDDGYYIYVTQPRRPTAWIRDPQTKQPLRYASPAEAKSALRETPYHDLPMQAGTAPSTITKHIAAQSKPALPALDPSALL